jgi:integrase/recombinase XerD
MSFKKYLQQANYSASTIKRYLSWEGEFLRYFVGYKAEELDYNQLLSYLVNKEAKGLARGTLVHILARIKRYYQYLGVPNPLEGFKLKGYERAAVRRYLDAEELEQLQELCYQSKHWAVWQRLALSFLICQGLAVGELARLQVLHVDLQEPSITTPTGSLAKRRLNLRAFQALILMDFVDGRSGQEWLFEELEAGQVKSRYRQLKELLTNELARKNLVVSFESLQQLRASRIRYWIELTGLLTAQYRAGHYHVSSTQAYQLDQNEGLRAAFEEIHPMF